MVELGLRADHAAVMEGCSQPVILKRGVRDFSERILNRDDAVFTAPETRTSAPLRILRDAETLQSKTVEGLYPCGEGAGYAGGITSAAVDGIRVAEAVYAKLKK